VVATAGRITSSAPGFVSSAIRSFNKQSERVDRRREALSLSALLWVTGRVCWPKSKPEEYPSHGLNYQGRTTSKKNAGLVGLTDLVSSPDWASGTNRSVLYRSVVGTRAGADVGQTSDARCSNNRRERFIE
jgi:hypothetical protein